MERFPISEPKKAKGLQKDKEKVFPSYCNILCKFKLSFEMRTLTIILEYMLLIQKSRRSGVGCPEELVNLRIQVWWPMDET